MMVSPVRTSRRSSRVARRRSRSPSSVEEGLDGGNRGVSTASGPEQGQFAEQLPRPQRRQRNDARGPGRRCLGPTFHDQIEPVVRITLYHYPLGRLEALLRKT